MTFFANPCTIVRTLLITCYENKGWLRLTESKSYKTFIFIRSAQQQRMFIRYCGCFTFREKWKPLTESINHPSLILQGAVFLCFLMHHAKERCGNGIQNTQKNTEITQDLMQAKVLHDLSEFRLIMPAKLWQWTLKSKYCLWSKKIAWEINIASTTSVCVVW